MLTDEVVGAVGISQMVVRPGDTALAHGSGDMPILSSSFLLTLMESACNSALAEFMENSEATVLSGIELEMHHPVGIGSEIQGSATCVAIDGNRIDFICEIHDGPRLVAAARIERTVVERMSYLARVAALALMSQQDSEF